MTTAPQDATQAPIAWLALRDGMAPIYGLSPEDVNKAGLSNEFRPYRKIGLTTRRNAICKRLFGSGVVDFQRQGWSAIQRDFDRHGLGERRDLLDVPGSVAHPFAPARGRGGRRRLADRLFFGPGPLPSRIFTGHGHDSSWWDEINRRHYRDRLLVPPHATDAEARPSGIDEARVWVNAAGPLLSREAGYFEGLYMSPAPAADLDAIRTYFRADTDEQDRSVGRQQHLRVTGLLMEVVHEEPKGWLDVVRLTDNVIAFRAPEGSYDLVWRDLRESPEPAFECTAWNAGPPRLLVERETILRERYRSPGVWQQMDEHRSEILHYASSRPGSMYPGKDVILERYLRDEGLAISDPLETVDSFEQEGSDDLEDDFDMALERTEGVEGFRVTPLVTNRQYRAFLKNSTSSSTANIDAFRSEYGAANEKDDDESPVGVSYAAALAYAAWAERRTARLARLPTEAEHRALRAGVAWSADPDRYDKRRADDAMAHPSAVLWSDDEERADARLLRARWVEPIRYTVHAGVTFMDAWDAPEWCMEGLAASRIFTKPFGTDEVGGSWGEYQRCKICFRLVIDDAVT